MFYKAIGFVTWKLASAYVRRRLGRRARMAGLAAVASVLVVGYLVKKAPAV